MLNLIPAEMSPVRCCCLSERHFLERCGTFGRAPMSIKKDDTANQLLCSNKKRAREVCVYMRDAPVTHITNSYDFRRPFGPSAFIIFLIYL
jgi:hypothetical protein